MSTNGTRTRQLLDISVKVERSFEDYGGIRDVAEQINEPQLEIRIGRFHASVRRWTLPKNAKSRWHWAAIETKLHIIRTPLALVELYLEDRFGKDERYSYSGDWGPYHDRMIR